MPSIQTYEDARDTLSKTFPDGEVVTSGYTAQGWFGSQSTQQGTTTTTTTTYIGDLEQINTLIARRDSITTGHATTIRWRSSSPALTPSCREAASIRGASRAMPM